ncbi:helix-turn-helix domain-containing protein [Lactobacillus helveticus]|uniref:helix-turn-helix domain-containing protein n=1 Tax=Lactobacillus helveticus TaxID=1587 RepID=UPI0011095280|nr:helix-turn-helix transcriptional regulator [Lactobacillus helveticus]TLQ24680.1 helix-turn-helix transcriptional regulator [Lactobacillus helveticus]
MNRIKEIRKKKGLSLQQVADAVGLGNNTISRYETGKREPKLETWKKLADFFGVSVPYLQGLTIDRYDVLKVLNRAYYDFFKYPKPKSLVNCINDFIELVGISAPKSSLSEADLKKFSDKAFNYWNENFDFLFVCDRIEYLFDLPRLRVSNEEIERQVIWTIEEIEIKLTSTKISEAFDNIVDSTLDNYYENREKLVRFNTKKKIEEYTVLLFAVLQNFLDEMKNLPENSKEQYTPQIARTRLNKFVDERKKNQLYCI